MSPYALIVHADHAKRLLPLVTSCKVILVKFDELKAFIFLCTCIYISDTAVLRYYSIYNYYRRMNDCFVWLYYNYIVSNYNKIIIIISYFKTIKFLILNNSMKSEVFSK